MLANFPDISFRSGTLGRDVHLPATSRRELIDFIADQLPLWRDRKDRKSQTAETMLTSQLCAHMNSVARHSQGWDFLQFRIEEPDEKKKGRKIDLVPAPCGVTVWIEGRRHADFDSLLPIECKRMPTPKVKDRDEREYVVSQYDSTGGIQRFKAGNHGSDHRIGAMIAYVQEETNMIWSKRVRGWIKGLAESGQPGWSVSDLLSLERNDATLRLAIFRSAHARDNNIPDIELHHLWIEMN